MSKIVELYDKLSMNLHVSPQLEQSLHTELAKIVSNAYTQDMGSDEGYCFKFNLPLAPVNKLYKLLNFDQKDVFEVFKADWGTNAMRNHMYSDSYYQILILIIFYGLKEKKDRLTENAFLIVLFKIWNGRKSKYLKYCDKRIMKYVVAHMCTNRHLFAKYDSPLAMLRDYFRPTLLKKYGPEILRNPKKMTMRLIEQSWGRINQQFVQNSRVNIKTGKKYAQAGILPMYMKAKKEGLSITNPTIKTQNDEEDPAFSEYTTVSNRDDIITSTSDYITMNPNPKYQPQFISQVNKKTKVSMKVIDKILKGLHNYTYHDIIQDILGIILSKTNVSDKNDICSPSYLTNIQKNIISSKNNTDARKLQKLSNILLDKIFKNILQRSFNTYSDGQQIQLRNVIISGIVYNLRRNVCKSSTLG